MKKLVFALIFFFLASQSYAIENVDIGISSVSYDPSPVKPGEYVEITLNVINSGTKTADNLNIELIPEYPFSLDPNEDAVRTFSTFLSSQTAIITYKVRVDENAVEGFNTLKIKATCTSCPEFEKNFRVKVQTVDANIAVVSVEVVPEQIPPGSTGEVKITLKNLADSTVKDVKVKLDVSGTATPFAPIGSTTEKRIETLSSSSSRTIAFNLISESSAASKVYKIPISIEYNDELGNKTTVSDVIGVTIGDTPELLLTMDKTEIIESGTVGKITFNVINKGLVDVKYLLVTLGESDDYTITSPSGSIYIGNLDSDDFETAEFSIYANKDASGLMQVPVVLEYRDANNNEFTEKVSVGLQLYTKSEASRMKLKEGNGPGFKGYLIILVLIYLGYRKWKQRK